MFGPLLDNTFAVHNGFPVFWLAAFSIHFLCVCNTYLRSKWQSFLFSSRDSSQSPWYSYVCVSALSQAKLWKKNEWQWISLLLDCTWFGPERFYFRLPNWHSPSLDEICRSSPLKIKQRSPALPFRRNHIILLGEKKERHSETEASSPKSQHINRGETRT